MIEAGGSPGAGLGPWLLACSLLLALGIPPWALCGSVPEESPPASAPADPLALIERLEDPARDGVARPQEVIAALRVTPGQVIGDIGAGTGYFARRLARHVGPEGRVFAVDIEPRLLEELRRRATGEGITNIVAVLASPEDSRLAPASCDLLFLHHVYVHLRERVAYLRHLGTRLKPNGRIAIIGWRRAVNAPGPQQAQRREKALSMEQIVEELGAAGFAAAEIMDVLPEKYFLIASLRE